MNSRKKRMQLTCILMSLAMILSGAQKQKENEKPFFNSFFTTEQDFNDMKKGVDFSFFLPKTKEEACLRYLNLISLEYPAHACYPTYSTTNTILKNLNNLDQCNYEFDGNIEALISRIQENSAIYLENNSKYSSAFCEDKVSTENKDFEVALFNVLTDFWENATNDKNEDVCHMESLKIVFNYTESIKENQEENKIVVPVFKYLPNENRFVTYAYYVPTSNLIVLNIDSIKEYKGESVLLWEEIAYVLRHEVNHLRQYTCDCRGSISTSICLEQGYSSFFHEASAESEIYNIWQSPMIKEHKDDTNLHTYRYERKYEAMLLLLALGREDVSINDYYDSIFDSDFERFLKFLGAQTEEEKREMFDILNSMDATLFASDASFQYYASVASLSYNDAKMAVGFDYKIAIFRRVLTQLITYTKAHPDFSIQSHVYLYSLIKQILVQDAFYYNDDMTVTHDEEFLKQMEEIEQYYFAFLKEFYKQDVELIWDEIRNPMYTRLEEMETYRSMCSSSSEIDLLYVECVPDLYERFPILTSIVFASGYNKDYDNMMSKKYDPKNKSRILT